MSFGVTQFFVIITLLTWNCPIVPAASEPQPFITRRLFSDLFHKLFTSKAVTAIGEKRCRSPAAQRRALDMPTVDNIFITLRTPCLNVSFSMRYAGNLRKFPDFDANRNTVVFINGWNSSPNRKYVDDMMRAYHCRGGYNFLSVDATPFLQTHFDYGAAAQNVMDIGMVLAQGLVNMGVRPSNLHLVGHSLGAHVVGISGEYYRKSTGRYIQRITGLDPAKPCFSVLRSLSRKDAQFVDIIHSNPDVFGIEEPIGHADFYPIGLSPTHVNCSGIMDVCSHGLAIRYFTTTVFPGHENDFISTQCASMEKLFWRICRGQQIPMGYAVPKTTRGIYKNDFEEKYPPYIKVNQTCGLCKKKSNKGRRLWNLWSRH